MNDTVCRNAGEETGNASRHQQEREVGNDLYRLHRRNCRKNLSYVVEHGTDNADEPQVLFLQQLAEQCHAEKTEDSAGEGIEQRHRRTGEYGTQQDPQYQYRKGISRAVDHQHDQGNRRNAPAN